MATQHPGCYLSPPPATADTVITGDSLQTVLSCMQALDVVSVGMRDRSAAKAQRPPTSSASPPAVVKVAAGSSVGHQQDAQAKKGSSDSEPALTRTTSHDAGREQTEVRSASVDMNPLCCSVVFRFVCLFFRFSFCFMFVRIVQFLRVVLPRSGPATPCCLQFWGSV